jgi:hypothetical protein
MIAWVDSKELHGALLLIAIGGLVLLASREWSAKIAGGFLLLARLWFGDMTEVDWAALGISALVVVVFFWVPRRFPSLVASPLRRPHSAAPAGNPQPPGTVRDGR